MTLTYKEVAEIIRIIDASNLDELVVEVGDAKVHIRRNTHGGQATVLPAPSSNTSPESRSAPDGVGVRTSDALRARADEPAPQPAGRVAVRSPMVGVFYRAPSPKDRPFVEVGSKVKRGDPLCLIEVMKLFTTIAADLDGSIAQILSTNGDLVEFDQVLFVIEPATS